MADLDVKKLVDDMIAAAAKILGKNWQAAKEYAVPEFETLAQAALKVGRELAAGDISGEQARTMLQINRSSLATVTMTLKGMGMIAAEEAVNAAFELARGALNAVIGRQVL